VTQLRILHFGVQADCEFHVFTAGGVVFESLVLLGAQCGCGEVDDHVVAVVAQVADGPVLAFNHGDELVRVHLGAAVHAAPVANDQHVFLEAVLVDELHGHLCENAFQRQLRLKQTHLEVAHYVVFRELVLGQEVVVQERGGFRHNDGHDVVCVHALFDVEQRRGLACTWPTREADALDFLVQLQIL